MAVGAGAAFGVEKQVAPEARFGRRGEMPTRQEGPILIHIFGFGGELATAAAAAVDTVDLTELAGFDTAQMVASLDID